MVSFELLREEYFLKPFFPSSRHLFNATLFSQTCISFLGLSFCPKIFFEDANILGRDTILSI